MAQIDVTALLEPLGESAPSGDNLEYDATFQELETAARGKTYPEIGNGMIPAEPPDWNTVFELAVGLAERTHDLRIGMMLLRGALVADGLTGLDKGLALITGYVPQFWPSLHPVLDPDDDNDPTVRMNVVAELCD